MEKIKVMHNLYSWLPQTMTWLYEMLSYGEERELEHLIVSETKQNLDQFPMPAVFSAQAKTKINKIFQKILRTSGFRMHEPLLKEKILTEKPNILHSHFGNYGYYNHQLAKKYDLKHLVTFYGVDVNMLPKSLLWRKNYRQMFKQVDLVLCEGPFMAQAIEKLGCPKSKLQIQRIGINLKKIRFAKRVFKKGERLKFLIVGTFREKKGIPFALEALGKLKADYPDFEVTIVGDATNLKRDQSEKKLINQVIENYGLKNQVTMTGFIPYQQMIELSYNHHIFLSPSVTATDGDTEGGAPVTIIEMAASGMPVISTTHCDIPFVLGEKNRKLLSRERDSESLKNNILQLFSLDLEALENDNLSYIKENLDLEVTAKKLREIYQQLI